MTLKWKSEHSPGKEFHTLFYLTRSPKKGKEPSERGSMFGQN